MTFCNSPSLDQYQQGIPPKQRSRRKSLRTIILVLILLTVVLTLTRLTQGNRLALLTGTGTIEGTVVDEDGKPVAAAEILVEGTTLAMRSDADGHFELGGVPVGSRLVVVGKDGSGREYPAVVTAGAETSLAQVQWGPTEVPSR
jgi:hypothetical protein